MKQRPSKALQLEENLKSEEMVQAKRKMWYT